MKKLILALCLLYPIVSYSAEAQRINFNEYKNKSDSLAVECKSKGMSTFSGFCLSQQYDKQTTTSITVALQLISYEKFYSKCEHTDFSNRNELLIQSLNIEAAKMFYEEMKPQKEAIENYSDYFDVCKSKEENSLAVSSKLKWFEYMIDKSSNYIKDK